MSENNSTRGDMPVDEFRQLGHQMIDWIADYLKNIEQYPVLSQIKPGDVKNKLPQQPPETGDGLKNIFDDINNIIMPGITHWNHPGFMAYFNSTASGPGILAEFLSAAFNANGMLWRTCPSSTELEQLTLGWLRQMLILPDDYWGIIYDTASVSTLHAIAAAREYAGEKFALRKKGMIGNSAPRFRLYCSEQAHSSVDKGALTLGIGIDGIRKIAVDEKFRLIPGELKNAIDEDKANGWLPFCVVATIGTTSTTSIDPLDEIAKICNAENIWLHVDAAYGGTAAIVPEMRCILNGIEHADSIVVNPHKWMFTPVDLSAFFTRKPDVLKRAFSLVAEYLKTTEQNKVESYMDYGVQLGRRFRSLKLWFIIRYFGVDGIIERLRFHLKLTQDFAAWIKAHQYFKQMAPAPLSVICFRAVLKNKTEDEIDKLNEMLMNNVNSTGKIFLSHTKLHDRFVIRLAISGINTKEKHVELAKTLLDEKLNELKNNG
ncbi:MAG: amino acid decarboxylase [Ignavibacteriaceae bacterium]|nr:amino acid decarboxylase [Ignavibacteriaceae bacterium]